jgi:hypothetical protein
MLTMPSQKSQISSLFCGMAIALLCGTAAIAQTVPPIRQYGRQRISAQATVILALAKDSDPSTWDAIIGGLADKEWPVRAAACHAVAMHDEPVLREKVVPLLKDKRIKCGSALLRHIFA